MSLRIKNARVWTADAACPWRDSLAIRDGKIVEDDAAALRPGDSPERVIDARGRVIVPGLIDSHVHLLMAGRALGEVDLSAVRSRSEFESAIATAHERLPAEQWLIGRGWSEQNWPDHQPPRADWLAAAGRRPCVCHRVDIHAALVNDVVLEMIHASNLPDPDGGRIVRDASGQPTGLLLESAAWELVHPLIPSPDRAAKHQHLLAAQQHAHAVGLTAIGSMEFLKDVFEVFDIARQRDELTLRCAITLLDRAMRDEPISCDIAAPIAEDDRLSIRGFKTFIDGTLGSRTARMLADYADQPGERGMLVELAAAGRLNEWIHAVAATGRSPSMHAIGDEAVRLALGAIESLDPDVRRRVQPRVEHAQHLDPADLPRWPGVVASMQPLHKFDDARVIESRLGPDRARQAFAFRSLRDAGAILAFGSDWPVVSCDPLLGMRTAITGVVRDEAIFHSEQNVTVEQALLAYTRDAAFCLGLESCGVLRPGNTGDCVMFDVDPFAADWGWGGRPPRVILTVVGGKVVIDET